MAPLHARSLPALPRKVLRRARARRNSREEQRIQPCVEFDARAPALVLSPHWDDAVLSCWSVLAGAGDVAVVNLFGGIPAAGRSGVWEQIAGARDSAERTRMRMAEDARALAQAGREALSLPVLDEQYRRDAGVRVGLVDLDRALRSAEAGSASRVYAPAAIGGHADHLLARGYARALLAAGVPVSLYADVPYCFFHGWPSWVDGRPAGAHRNVDAYWMSFLGGVPEMPPLRSAEVLRLDPPSLSAKREAVDCYEASLNHGVRHLLGDPAFGGFEVRWALGAFEQRTPHPGEDGVSAAVEEIGS